MRGIQSRSSFRPHVSALSEGCGGNNTILKNDEMKWANNTGKTSRPPSPPPIFLFLDVLYNGVISLRTEKKIIYTRLYLCECMCVYARRCTQLTITL